MNFSTPPIIIGGSAGSGTRVFCQILIDAGVFMGTNFFPSTFDALDFSKFWDKWTNTWLFEKVNPLTPEEKNNMINEFQNCVNKHLQNMTNDYKNWGFKSPRSIHLLSFLHQQYSKMKFLHIIRDGRDMIYTNWGIPQTQMHSTKILNRELKDPVDLLDLWSIINFDASIYGETKMKENYKRIRFEDLCNNPEHIVKDILNFLGINNSSLTMINKIKTPTSIGRWQEHQKDLKISKLSIIALEYFGYL